MGTVTQLKTIKETEQALDLARSVGGLATFDDKKIAKIEQQLPAVDRENHTIGRKNTQTTNQLMTLNMMVESPYRRIRQCLSQIEDRRRAITETAFELKKDQVKIRRLRQSDDELDHIEADKLEYNMIRSRDYIDGAYKELATFLETKNEIQKAHNIPDNWDERDAELAEIDNHIKMAFKQAHRDVLQTGSIGAGNMEYLEQFGIHPQTAFALINNFIKEDSEMIEKGQAPTINRLYQFLDDMVETFKVEHHKVLKRIGIENLLKEEYLYLEDRNDS